MNAWAKTVVVASAFGASCGWTASQDVGSGSIAVTGDPEVLSVFDDTVLVWTNTAVSGSLTIPDDGNRYLVDYLVVGGGGAGGCCGAGGGGAGGVVYRTQEVLGPGEYAVSVGTGGLGRAQSPKLPGGNGGDTRFGDIVALGGGGGAGYVAGFGGSAGGSSGGSASNTGRFYEPGEALQPSSVSGGLGNAGGRGHDTYGSGGGGGAGGPGSANGRGGAGFRCCILGASRFFAGGGGGGHTSASNHDNRGSDGGGNGGLYVQGSTAGMEGANATAPGSGGGGSGYLGGDSQGAKALAGGNGAAGIVVVRFYKTGVPDLAPRSVGAEVKTKGQYILYTWTNTTEVGLLRLAKKYAVDLLVVGGGGGGGGHAGSGGGAGGVVFRQGLELEPDTYAVAVGVGGAGGSGDVNGVKGGDSKFEEFVAIGGGNGTSCYASDQAGGAGGSGGGSARVTAKGGAALQPSSAIGGLGNAGGPCDREWGTAGGGGAGGAGVVSTAGSGVGQPLSENISGGAGFSCAISGSDCWYAGGGGAGATTVVLATKGANGGGDGGIAKDTNTDLAVRGTDATTAGSGGGGGGYDQGYHGWSLGGKGADGIVILKLYRKSGFAVILN